MGLQQVAPLGDGMDFYSALGGLGSADMAHASAPVGSGLGSDAYQPLGGGAGAASGSGLGADAYQPLGGESPAVDTSGYAPMGAGADVDAAAAMVAQVRQNVEEAKRVAAGGPAVSDLRGESA